MHGYNQMQFDELSLAEKTNVITATILLSSKLLVCIEIYTSHV